MSQDPTTIRIKKKTKSRLEKLGDMRDSSDDVLQKLLRETWFLSKIKDALRQCETSVEIGKQRGHLNPSVADDLIRTVREFVEMVELR